MTEHIDRNTSPQLRRQFDTLVEKIQEETMKYAVSVAKDKQLADDLFSQAWWEVLDYFPRIRRKEPIPLRVFFQRVIRSRYSNWVTEQSKQTTLDTTVENSFLAPPIVLPNPGTEEGGKLMERLNTLNDNLQQVILLKSDGYDISEAAQIMGISDEEFTQLFDEAREQLIQGTCYQENINHT